MMNAAASLSSLCCSFIDLLSLAGKDTPEDKTQKLLCVLINIPVCVAFLTVPGAKTLALNRMSKMMSLTEPTSLHAARTAFVPRESPAILQKLVSVKLVDVPRV